MGKYIVHYWRYKCHYTEEFDTLKEAKRFLDDGEDYGELSTELIETPKGVIEGDTLHPLLFDRIPGCHAPEVSKDTDSLANTKPTKGSES